jgi:hypothetical protein
MEFQETKPPTANHRLGHNFWPGIAEELKKNPRKWAKVLTDRQSGSAAGFASSIRTGRSVAFQPQGTFEACSRTSGPGKADVWACYVGETNEQ